MQNYYEKIKRSVDNMNNIILIGMPGSGKSTIGVVLAKVLGYDFIDSDLLIQKATNRLLWQIMDEDGIDGFNKVEEEVNSSIEATNSVIATGGSAVYGEKAMKHLGDIGTIIYLDVSYQTLKNRLGDLKKRGVVLKPNQTLKDLYIERLTLYKKYAHITINADHMNIPQTIDSIVNALKSK